MLKRALWRLEVVAVRRRLLKWIPRTCRVRDSIRNERLPDGDDLESRGRC